jgi:outer membrane protein OmpA-like peptidoglycan-associated protein
MSIRMWRAVAASLLIALGCAAERGEVAPAGMATPERGSVLRAPDLVRVRCLVVAPFENASDSPHAAEAATSALVSAVDPARTRVFPVSDLRALFKETTLELPLGFPPSLALELAELVGADAALWGSVEGRSHEASGELLVTIRLALVGDHRLLFAETGLVKLAPGDPVDPAVRQVALDLARPMLTRLGDPGRKRCFDPERTRTLRRLALAEESAPRGTAAAPAAAPAPPAAAPSRAPRTPRQAEWAKRLAGGERVLVEDVTFAGRTAALQRDAGLADLAAAVLARPGVAVRLDGFVDATPDRSGDQRLSLAMAHAAGRRLVELGVPRQQLTWAGRGGESPILPNFTARGRAANRRIEATAAP